MISTSTSSAAATVAKAAMPLDDKFEMLIDRIGNSEIVLMGEASHGTHEFYSIREQLTRRLISDHGFRILALEADWPDTLRVHRYVTGSSNDFSAAEALSDFRRFPSWMWRNTVMTDFIDWLTDWNASRHPHQVAGIFGMDLYSMHTSVESVLDYLQKVDPEAAERARNRYACFDHFGPDPQQYGYETSRGGSESCEDEVVTQLTELRERQLEFIRRDGKLAKDEFFFAEQNARLVANAERYYRSMFRGRHSSWNLRDQHMAETLSALVGHFDDDSSKLVVWAHNSHLGDARATQMGRRGEWNVGQLMREKFAHRVFNIGFSTYTGTVTAARDWGQPGQRRLVRPGLPESYEALFHEVDNHPFWLDLRSDNAATRTLREPRLQRAIGVVYRPETERGSNYFEASLPDQFDAMIHLDVTQALEPLERNSEWDESELPETFPSGL